MGMNINTSRNGSLAILLGSVLWLTATLPAQAQEHTLNLQDADIQVLIATVAEITGKSFIIDPRVTGKVTVISARSMEEDQIYRIFLSVHEIPRGFTSFEHVQNKCNTDSENAQAKLNAFKYGTRLVCVGSEA